MDYSFLLWIAIILLSTKILGVASQKINMPQVVGALLAGIILGPSVLNVVSGTDFINQVAEIGVILLMFQAGLGTDFTELKKTGVASLVIALIGVIVPMIGGALTYCTFFGFEKLATDSAYLIEVIFVGVVLMATSVSITVETLREMGKLNGRMGTAILGAAIIDDIIGIIVLTLITSLKDPKVDPGISILKIVLFFVFIGVVAVIVNFFMTKVLKEIKNKHRVAIFSLSFAFFMSFFAEHFFGVADITGAYFAGLILCNTSPKNYVDDKVNITSYMIFGPVFFASIGIKTDLSNGMDMNIIWFSLALLVVAVLSKIIGCGLGAKLCKFNNKDALAIGVGMVSRGEVALIVADKGTQAGIIDAALYPAIVLVVIVTTVITPVLLKMVLAERNNKKKNKNSKKTQSTATAG